MTARDLGLALLAALIWGATFPVTRAALNETPPLLFAALRFAAAAAFVVVVPRPAVSWRWLVAAGLLLGVGQYGLLFVAMERGLPTGLASLLIHTQALFTVVIARIAFGERLRRRQHWAIALAAAGLALLALERSGAVAAAGLALVLTAALSAAAGNNVLKRLGDADKLGVAVWMSVAAPLPLLLLSLRFDPNTLVANLTGVGWTTVAAVVYSALLATILAFAIWGRLLSRYPAGDVAPFFLLVPVFGVGLSTALLDESISTLQTAGGGLVFCALALTLGRRRRAANGANPRC